MPLIRRRSAGGETQTSVGIGKIVDREWKRIFAAWKLFADGIRCPKLSVICLSHNADDDRIN